MGKANRVWLYHPVHGAKQFEFNSDSEQEAYLEDGWFDTPAAFDKSDENQREVDAAAELVVEARIVRADDNLSVDDGLSAMSAYYGLSDDHAALLKDFLADNQSLTKQQHVELGKGLGIRLISSWNEGTLIAKINEKLHGDD